MRQFSCPERGLIQRSPTSEMKLLRSGAFAPAMLGACVIAAIAASPAHAQDHYSINQNYNNRYGLDLPSVPIPNGQDEVRAADGTTCKTTVASNGAYFDTGVIGSNSQGTFNAGGVYGRIVVPLGDRPSRIDCRELFALEIERLRLELQLVKMGIGGAKQAYTGSLPQPEALAPGPDKAAQAASAVIRGGAPAPSRGSWTTEVVPGKAGRRPQE